MDLGRDEKGALRGDSAAKGAGSKAHAAARRRGLSAQAAGREAARAARRQRKAQKKNSRTDLEQAEKDALRGGSTRRRCRALACPRHRDGRGRAAGLVQQVAPQEVLLPGLLGCEFELVEEVLEVVCSREDR